MAELDLAGVTIALTAERRSEEFATLLERRGAETVRTPVIHVLPLVDDADLRVQTEALIADPPELVVISTGIGFRGWLEAVESWDLTEQFLGALNRTRIVARGPKAMGAIRGAGLREEWSPSGESSEEVLTHLAGEGVDGVRVAVQLHGIITEWEPLTDLSASLTDIGAVVTAVSVYRWIRPPDQSQVRALVSAVRSGSIDALTFTSAPAVSSMLSTAKEMGELERFVAAMRDNVPTYCVGPVTAAPLELLGVPTIQPERSRLGALARLIIEDLPRRRALRA
ncbi:uroporphyrinogen-III synthase [Rhodococcus sp. AD45-ID]|uniref:Uroporphyrinogen-III synthase n=2 Tax=Nocardiaceae TaxID=85025 RepID=A0A652YSP4_NOCGL|nr:MULTISPECIES: uroporphyrinogen-III synthase [Rhodococcus]NMD61552.1 uroporphyrinogen-III synthase [Nocardia globerula]NRI69024.1 uroporphyrinogen-III synthase [Rhodococcus sp. MS16]KJF21573.1 bifunctional uroporphyrinogen-III synthetase/response regulator domain protein [Rhodococcus sp. AD45]MDV6266387.1 uroporphyrinogen-III synthase [Rhodococcus globerulus]PSR39038.1 uroporphyrinogen-III synthase [Rhodococcus sp. AD45-ID]